MKKSAIKVLLILFLLMFCTNLNEIQAISSSFKFVIDTVGIPRYNVNKEEINEDVYKIYNVFCYGSPQKIKGNGQRWTSSKYGKWTKGGGPYEGSGTRGEYYVLGKSYNGEVVHNYYFPLDVVPNITPDKWTFYDMPGALNSWKDKSNYKYEEQLEFMKNTNLLFNDLSSKANAMNPNLIKTYNISPKSIGLGKAKLDTSATWKTNGIIYTRRLISGKIWTAIFLTPPMAANAKLVTSLDTNDTVTLNADQDEILVPIDFGGSVVNATGYASRKHVKEINISLYINGEKVDNISGSKTMNVGSKYMFKVTREKFSPNKTHSVKIISKGYLHTEFSVDGLLQASTEKEIKIKIEPKRIIPIRKGSMQILSKDTDKWVVSPLAQTISTANSKSEGFTEAGKYLAIKLDLNIDKNKMYEEKIYLDNKLIKKEVICNEINKASLNPKREIFAIKIPTDTKTTIYGWSSLRDSSQSYFNIDNTKLLDRIISPHVLKITFKYNSIEYIHTILFDTMDNYLTNINWTLENSVLNINQVNTRETIEKWLTKT